MKILMIGNNLSVQSGVQRYIQNLLLHIDPKRYQVDLFVAPCPKGQVSSQPSLEARGVNLILGSDNDKQRPWELAGYLRNHHDYDIVHYHINSKVSALSCIVIKMLCPHAKLIVHSHVVYPPLTFGWRVAHLLYQMTADYFLGCGVEAGKFAFGSRINHRNNFSVACNAVDRSVFFPDDQARANIRAQYGITNDERLCGFVGRYNHEKNILFLLDVFSEMYKLDRSWRLLLVGCGVDQEKVDKKIEKLGLQKYVYQAGLQEKVAMYMSAFDLFVLPSEFEASPITLVEAQACGVPCLVSSRVPRDGAVTDLVHFLALEDSAQRWAQLANRLATGEKHADRWEKLTKSGYELQEAAARMQKLYDKMVRS